MKYGIMIFTAILLALAVLVSACANNSETIPETKYCTEDAKVCPDGSAVGRDANNNCEFFPCPEVNDTDETPVANKFWCRGKSYDVSEVGFCARALLVRGMTCIISDHGDIIIPEEEYDAVKECVDLRDNRQETFACKGDYYNVSEVGTCSRVRLAEGSKCMETEFGDIIYKTSQESSLQKCIMTCGNAGPELERIDENGVHSCTCSIEGMSCEGLSKSNPVNNIQDLSLGGQCQTDADCMTGGCSGQLCGLKDVVGDTITTCEYRNDYACLKETSCGCNDGICQWANTPEYQQCLEGLQ